MVTGKVTTETNVNDSEIIVRGAMGIAEKAGVSRDTVRKVDRLNWKQSGGF